MKSGLDSSESSLPDRQIDWPVILIIALGASLRSLQYLSRSSLWGDELAIAMSLRLKDTLHLVTQPLLYEQMAPAGFLLLLKGVTSVAGMSELSLRLIPFLSSLLSLYLFWRFSRIWLSRPTMLLALGVFALCPPLIRHAAQTKPYSSDVVLCLLCLLAAHAWFTTESPRAARRLAALGAIAIWFSYPAFFVVAAIGTIVLARWKPLWSSGHARQLGTVVAAWSISGGAFALFERHRSSESLHGFMLAFWGNWLMPSPLTFDAIRAYSLRIVRDCLSYFLHLPKWPAILGLLCIGAIYLLRRNWTAWLVVLPLLITLAASVFRLYPFSGRLILFLVPTLFVLIAAGIELIIITAMRFQFVERNKLWFSIAFGAAAVFLCAWPLRAARPPYRNSETRPMISYLGDHRQQGDAIYVHNMAWLQYQFYGPQFGLQANQAVSTSDMTAMGPRPEQVLVDLDQFRGRSRVWILFGGGYSVEETCALEYLDRIGVRLDRQTALDSSVYLYDLRSRESNSALRARQFFDGSRSDAACYYDTIQIIGPQP